MKTLELKVARIGNSRGVRLPAASLKRYDVGSILVMEERSDGILLKPKARSVVKLDWEGTAREMETAGEDWSEWDALDGDGLGSVPWEREGKKIAEEKGRYGPARRARKEAVKRYEIRWASLDPARGAEMAKTRPVVVVSLDELNARLDTVTVCPITSRLHPAWRCRLQVRCAGKPAEVAADQIRTISKNRLGPRMGRLADEQAAALRRLLTEMYGE